MAVSTSNQSFLVGIGEEYPYPSGNFSTNIVTMKMSGRATYNVWRSQMICLLTSHGMLGFINGEFVCPDDENGNGKVGDMEAWKRSDSLVHGWILGSLSAYLDTRQTLYLRIQRGDPEFLTEFEWEGLTPMDRITKNGNTALHVAVGSSTKNLELLERLLAMVPEESTVWDARNSDGRTVLHVAAIVGNTEAVILLLEKDPNLLIAKDKWDQTPLALSLLNKHTQTSRCLLSHVTNKEEYAGLFYGQIGDELLVLAISSKDFCLARELLENYVDIHSEDVLMAIAQNFPRELNFWERRLAIDSLEQRVYALQDKHRRRIWLRRPWVARLWRFFIIVISAILWLCENILLHIVSPFVKERVQSHRDAKLLLYEVCSIIKYAKESNVHHLYYTNPIFEATIHDAFEVVTEIMYNFPDALWSTNNQGQNFVHYAMMYRSENIYNMLQDRSQHFNMDSYEDYDGNNILHLAARLSPANKLDHISGEALQIQRELQWFKEVQQFVNPIYTLQKNNSGETPEMVFSKEHRKLVADGEKWMKSTADSYTVSAALITTIAFAAAITVPGGNNQDTGLPIFTNKTAFAIFAVSNAVSLFTAVTSLLMFLAIPTAHFSEENFLIKLPTKLIIGLATLFISMTSLIVASAAVLFLVYAQSNSWILIPIAALTCLPMTSFVTLQFPLIANLMIATYGRSIFVKKRGDLPYF